MAESPEFGTVSKMDIVYNAQECLNSSILSNQKPDFRLSPKIKDGGDFHHQQNPLT